MPFNGSGQFQRVMNWVNDAASNIKIRADRHDQEDNNLADGLSQCITKNGETTPTANIPMGNKRIVNLADPVNPQDAMTLNYLQANAFNIAGNDNLGRLNFTGSQTDPTGATGRLGISFSQADLFFGVRRSINGPPAAQAAFVWHDNAAGTGNAVMRVDKDGALSLNGAMYSLVGIPGAGNQVFALSRAEADAAGNLLSGGIVAVRGNASAVPTEERMGVAIYTGYSAAQGGSGANLFGRAGYFDATKNLIVAGELRAGGVVGSWSANLILATTGDGVIYFRPKGAGVATNQAYIDTTGNFVAAGSVIASNAVFASTTGSLYLRPVAHSSATGQCILDSSGNFGATGGFTTNNGVHASNVGTLYLRPNGIASATGQAYIAANGDASFTGDINTAGAVVAVGYRCRTGVSGSYQGNNFNFQFTNPGVRMWIDSTMVGQISFSDYRMKRDIADLPGTWDRIKALRPISYRIKEAFDGMVQDDDQERWGFVAHELQETLIEDAATGSKDEDNVIQTPNPWPVLAAVVRALQEAMDRIETLEGAAA